MAKSTKSFKKNDQVWVKGSHSIPDQYAIVRGKKTVDGETCYRVTLLDSAADDLIHHTMISARKGNPTGKTKSGQKIFYAREARGTDKASRVVELDDGRSVYKLRDVVPSKSEQLSKLIGKPVRYQGFFPEEMRKKHKIGRGFMVKEGRSWVPAGMDTDDVLGEMEYYQEPLRKEYMKGDLGALLKKRPGLIRSPGRTSKKSWKDLAEKYGYSSVKAFKDDLARVNEASRDKLRTGNPLRSYDIDVPRAGRGKMGALKGSYDTRSGQFLPAPKSYLHGASKGFRVSRDQDSSSRIWQAANLLAAAGAIVSKEKVAQAQKVYEKALKDNYMTEVEYAKIQVALFGKDTSKKSTAKAPAKSKAKAPAKSKAKAPTKTTKAKAEKKAEKVVEKTTEVAAKATQEAAKATQAASKATQKATSPKATKKDKDKAKKAAKQADKKTKEAKKATKQAKKATEVKKDLDKGKITPKQAEKKIQAIKAEPIDLEGYGTAYVDSGAEYGVAQIERWIVDFEGWREVGSEGINPGLPLCEQLLKGRDYLAKAFNVSYGMMKFRLISTRGTCIGIVKVESRGKLAMTHGHISVEGIKNCPGKPKTCPAPARWMEGIISITVCGKIGGKWQSLQTITVDPDTRLVRQLDQLRDKFFDLGYFFSTLKFRLNSAKKTVSEVTIDPSGKFNTSAGTPLESIKDAPKKRKEVPVAPPIASAKAVKPVSMKQAAPKSTAPSSVQQAQKKSPTQETKTVKQKAASKGPQVDEKKMQKVLGAVEEGLDSLEARLKAAGL